MKEKDRVIVDLRKTTENQLVDFANLLHNNGVRWISGRKIPIDEPVLGPRDGDAIQIRTQGEDIVISRGTMQMYKSMSSYKGFPVKTIETCKYLFNNK